MKTIDPEFRKAINKKDVRKIKEYLDRGVPNSWSWSGKYKPTNVLSESVSYIWQDNVMHLLARKDILHFILPVIFNLVPREDFLIRENLLQQEIALFRVQKLLHTSNIQYLTPIHIVLTNKNPEAIHFLMENCQKWKIDLHTTYIATTLKSFTSTIDSLFPTKAIKIIEYAISSEQININIDVLSPVGYVFRSTASIQYIINNICSTPELIKHFLKLTLTSVDNSNNLALQKARNLFIEQEGINIILAKIRTFYQECVREELINILVKIFPTNNRLLTEEFIEILPKLYPKDYPVEFEHWTNQWGKGIIDSGDFGVIKGNMPIYKKHLADLRKFIEILPKLYPKDYPVEFERWTNQWGKGIIDSGDFGAIEKNLPILEHALLEQVPLAGENVLDSNVVDA